MLGGTQIRNRTRQMNYDKSDTAIVFTDPQTDFLSQEAPP